MKKLKIDSISFMLGVLGGEVITVFFYYLLEYVIK